MKQRITKGVLMALAALAAASAARTQTTRTWTGGVNSDWHTAGNWSGGAVPTDGDTVVIASGTVAITNATPALAAFTNQAGVVTFSNWWARLEATEVSLTGGTLKPSNAFAEAAMSNRVWIVCSNLTVGASAVIHADGLGYTGLMAASGQGPGKSGASQYRTAGAGHGGRGGRPSDSAVFGAAYGDAIIPTAPGSSSAGRTQSGQQLAGNPGGGAIRIDATGDILVDGRISVDGIGNTRYIGGGSGGSILILCRTLRGSGTLRADGGAAFTNGGGGEGGGGRIAVHYDTTAQAQLAVPTLALSAAAGKRDHHTESQFGTVYLPDARFLTPTVTNLRGWLHIPNFAGWSPASLTLNNSHLGFLARDFELSVAGDVLGTGNRMLAFASNAVVSVSGKLETSLALEQGGSCTASGDILLPATTANNYHNLTFEADVTANGSLALEGVWRNTSAPTNGIASHGALIAAGTDMTIANNATLFLYSNPTNGGSALLQMDNLLIAAGAVINADDGGFGGRHNEIGYGPGGGGRGGTYASGGGFGGRGGGSAGGPANGLAYAPLWPGSAGGGRSASGGNRGNSGGGLVRIEASGHVTVDGTVTANGSRALSYVGSGAGGGIFIRSTSFGGAANGVLRAHGGSTNTGGGSGGGGRIAVWHGPVDEASAAKILAGQHEDLGASFLATTTLTSFAGSATAVKGTGFADAEDGTVFFVTVLPPSGTVVLLR